MIYQEDCIVVENKKIAQDYYKISFISKKIHKKALPGQFVHVLINNKTVFLRRPFSIHQKNNDGFSIIYHVVGKGTKALAKIKPQEKLNIIGPLGNGFKIHKNKIAVLIAGGCGVAPLYFLENELNKKKIKSHFFMGATTESLLLCRSDFSKIGTKLYISTDDGSCGEKCTISALFSTHLKALNPKKIAIYTCGPKAMLKTVSEIAKRYNIPCQVSLEEYMACGIGACLGCVVETKNGNKRVCKDGPVFDAKDIVW